MSRGAATHLKTIANDIGEVSKRLDPVRFAEALTHFTSGGPSISDYEAVSHSSEPPAPQFDGDDRKMRQDAKKYTAIIAEARRALQVALRIQQRWCDAVPLVEIRLCANPECRNVLDEARGDVCMRCYRHEARHGKAWPRKSDGTYVRSFDDIASAA